VIISSWGEANVPNALGTQRDNAKFWAGAGGYPGVGLLRDALDAARPHMPSARPDPFNVSAPQSSSFRFDWRRDYIPIDIGFSLNEHPQIQPRGYPIVEVLAAVGLSHARPDRLRKLAYRYAVAGRSDRAARETESLLPAPLVRAALGVAALPFPTRTFAMHLDWPGQENQARCITTVHEETAR
jgi:CRISPR-associated protein Csx14